MTNEPWGERRTSYYLMSSKHPARAEWALYSSERSNPWFVRSVRRSSGALRSPSCSMVVVRSRVRTSTPSTRGAPRGLPAAPPPCVLGPRRPGGSRTSERAPHALASSRLSFRHGTKRSPAHRDLFASLFFSQLEHRTLNICCYGCRATCTDLH